MPKLSDMDLIRDANLKAYYPLESDLDDYSGQGKHLTAVSANALFKDSGIFAGKGLRLPASGFASLADNLGVDGGACSIIVFLKQETELGTGVPNFIQQNSAGTVTGNGIGYEYNGGTRRLYFRRSRWNVVHQGPYYNVALGLTPRCVIYTYDGTNIRGYLDGALVAGPTAASGNGTGVVPNTFVIAATPSGNSIFREVCFLNKALTADEALAISAPEKTKDNLTNYRGRKRTPGAVSV